MVDKQSLAKKKLQEAQALREQADRLTKEALALQAAPASKTTKKDDTSSSSASSSDSSDSESESEKKVVTKATKKKEESSDDDSSSDSDSSDDEDVKPAAKTTTAKTTTPKKTEVKISASSSDSGSSSSSDSEEEAEKTTTKKVVTPKKETKRDDDESSTSSSGSSSSSSSSSSDSEDEEKQVKPSLKRKEVSADKPAIVESERPVKKQAFDSNDEMSSTKIYVRGLPWRVSDEEVRDFFAGCGEIVSCELPLQDDGRASGTAIIEYTSPDGSAAAMELNGADFQGRWLSIKYSTPKTIASGGRESTPKEPGCVTVFVGNLPWDVDEQVMRDTFAECGEITGVRFATDRETGDFKGFGHVEFATTEATDAAVALAGTDVMGRQIRVDYAPDKKKSFSPGGFGGGSGGGRGGGRGYMRDGGRGGSGRGGGRGGGGRGGGRGGGFGSDPSKAKKSGAIAGFAGKKITFD